MLPTFIWHVRRQDFFGATHVIWYRYGIVAGERIDGKIEAFWKYTPGTSFKHKNTPSLPSRSATFRIYFYFIVLCFESLF